MAISLYKDEIAEFIPSDKRDCFCRSFGIAMTSEGPARNDRIVKDLAFLSLFFGDTLKIVV
ncbi:MAG: hypothetical protein HY752_02890 [Nitrospirae bacterium]|nr:hypothetical protein [Nitrospirota bacterium]